MMFLAECCHVLQFFAAPDATRWVVGVAKQEYGTFLVSTVLLEILPVYLKLVAVIIKLQYAF